MSTDQTQTKVLSRFGVFSAQSRSMRLDWFAIVLLLGLAILRLPEPLWGDQALFMLGGAAMDQGAMLYRDFWDIKPPGIFWAYYCAGKVFGFTGIGMHGFDGLWMGTLAIVLRVTLAQYFTRSWIPSLLPWLSLGIYWSVMRPNDQMQVESLVGLPIYLLIWCTWQAFQNPQQRSRWLFASGLLGGVVVIFKLIFLPFLACFWLVYAFQAGLVKFDRLFDLGRSVVLPVALGLLVPIVPVLLYWADQGMLGEMYFTLVTHPANMVKALPKKSPLVLVLAIAGFAKRFFPVLLLAIFTVLRLRNRLDFLMMQMVVWLVAGLGVIAAQTQSWWAYHFFLLMVPVAVLGAKGVDLALSGQHRPSRQWGIRFVGGALLTLLLLNGLAIANMGRAMAQSGLPTTPDRQLAYSKLRTPRYAQMAEEVGWMNESGRKPGDIYVLGDPTFYVLTDRKQAIAHLGWIPEMMLPEQWVTVEQQLDQARPVYLYVGKDAIEHMTPQFVDFVNRQYRTAQTTIGGTWYELAS